LKTRPNPRSSAYSATHAAISTLASEAEIIALANREGWRALRCSRDGFFDVIEFWVENRLLLELLPPISCIYATASVAKFPRKSTCRYC